MGKGNETASWSLNLDGNVKAEANAEAEALERLTTKIRQSETAIASLSKASKRLAGDSAEVATVREQLAKKMVEERTKLSTLQVQLSKSGTTLERVASAQKKKLLEDKKSTDTAKKHAEAQRTLAESMAKGQDAAISFAGGPIGRLKAGIQEVKELLAGGSGAANLLTLAVAGLAAALAAVSVAAIGAGVALSKWILTAANAQRASLLAREAFTGTATSAVNLGDQITLLSSKISTPKAQLQELAKALAKTRLSGQQQVDTLNLVGQAADAMGDDVGNALKDIATRGQLFGRFQVSPLELIGKGFDFNDLAGTLAKGLGVSIDTAKKALFEGRVKLDDGLKALRSTVEKRFAEINARKALDLNVQLERMHEKLGALTKDVKLEPLLKGFEKLGKDLDDDTFTGRALHDMITQIGDGLAKTIGDQAPLAHKAVQGLVIGALTAGVAFLRLRNALRDTFHADTLKNIDLMGVALATAAAPGNILAAALDSIRVTLVRADLILTKVGGEFSKISDGATQAFDKVTGIKWEDLGMTIATGFAHGIELGATQVVKDVESMADQVKAAFKKSLGISSPSKVFAEYGEDTPAGYAQGVDKGTPKAQGAVDAMVQEPSAFASPGAARGGGGGGGVQVIINLPPGADAGAVRELEKQRPAIAAELTTVLRQLQARGGY